MANNGFINFRIGTNYRTNLQKSLISKIKDPKVMQEINEHIKDEANNYVPSKSGLLRSSGYATPQKIGWRTPYAHYQYIGQVYAVNNIGWVDGSIAWRTPRGMKKVSAGRELGVPGSAELSPKFGKGPRDIMVTVTFGYTSPGTKHHWMHEMWMERKRSVQQWITKRLKDALNGR